jgi:hypothetical protein
MVFQAVLSCRSNCRLHKAKIAALQDCKGITLWVQGFKSFFITKCSLSTPGKEKKLFNQLLTFHLLSFKLSNDEKKTFESAFTACKRKKI